MRAEKKLITKEYVSRLKASPFFMVVDYKGLTVGQFTELRKRLNKGGSEVHVVKNSIFSIAAKEAGVSDLAGTLAGQLDISAAAKTLKKFQSEFDKPKLKFGYLQRQRLETSDLMALADLPSIEVLRGRLRGVLQAPAAQLARLLNTPASQLVRVLQARVDKAA